MIGQVDDAGIMPVTDQIRPLNRLVTTMSADARIQEKTRDIRILLLENLFPSPDEPLSAMDILHFKEKHGALLVELRNYIEQSIIDILNVTDFDLRERKIVIFNQKSQTDIEELVAIMSQNGWIGPTFSNLYGLASEAPVIGIPMKITRAVYKAATDSYKNEIKMTKETPLLYAAVAQRELLVRKR